MKKLWLSALTTATLVAGMSLGTAAWAGDRHHHHHRDHDRWEHYDHRGHGHWKHHRHHHHYRPYREVREVYYAPPRYYRPAPVYYPVYGRDHGGVRGTISVDF